MEKVPVALPSIFDFAQAEQRIEDEVAAVGLTIVLKGTLKQLPGSLHWHAKLGKQTGTLELTLLADKREFWFSIHSNRQGDWVMSKIQAITIGLTS